MEFSPHFPVFSILVSGLDGVSMGLGWKFLCGVDFIEHRSAMLAKIGRAKRAKKLFESRWWGPGSHSFKGQVRGLKLKTNEVAQSYPTYYPPLETLIHFALALVPV